jgi:hypothetical protein
MSTRLALALLLLLTAFLVPTSAAFSQETLDQRVATLEGKVGQLESQTAHLSAVTAAVLFLYGAFCALWAQQTGRSAWVWFFLGVLFNAFTAIAVLYNNYLDLKWQRFRNQQMSRV